MPPDAAYIGRQMRFLRLPRSKWANAFKIGRDGTRTEVITKYRNHLLSRPELIAALPELRGKDLACWCAPEPCHGEVLLEPGTVPGFFLLPRCELLRLLVGPATSEWPAPSAANGESRNA